MSRLRSSEETATVADLVAGEWPVAAETPDRRMPAQFATRWLRSVVLAQLGKMTKGCLSIEEGGRRWCIGERSDRRLAGTLVVRDPRFYRMAVWGGDVGAAEAYLRGYWDSPDLANAMQVLAANLPVLQSLQGPARHLRRPWSRMVNWLQRNSLAGSRRNIAAHYDLSNEFFALWLDRTMTYSSGIFRNDEATLEDASVEKYDRICRRLKLKPNDHVLEIGAGWGGFAEHAASRYGCRVTTTTISEQQHAYAQRRFQATSLDQRVRLLKHDYRQLEGVYDKIVSIEMIEAVGEKYLHGYFRKCCQLLKPDGSMMLQSIIIPDSRYDAYRRSSDFIKTYIFPGGHLPSVGALAQSAGRSSGLQIIGLDHFAPDYARTLARWRKNFWQRVDQIRRLGFDDRFIRMWNYYLAYCEAAFATRQIDVVQVELQR